MFKIAKTKVDNLVVLTLLYSLIWIFLSHSMYKFVFNLYSNATSTCGYITKCIKRVGGFPNKVMGLVATLGIDVALT